MFIVNLTNLMFNNLKEYKKYFSDKQYLWSISLGFLLFLIGIIVTYFAIIYATESSSNPVTDIILSNTKVFDVDGIFVYGPVIFWAIIIIYILLNPKKIPFTLKSLSISILVRSAFISMTHIGPFPTHTQIVSNGLLGVFTTGNDLFFSGHTGFPFLMALIFWDNKYLRFFCLSASLFFGTVVLLGHLHYSIDVFAAFFIVYTIFCLAKKIFKKDYVVFNGIS